MYINVVNGSNVKDFAQKYISDQSHWDDDEQSDVCFTSTAANTVNKNIASTIIQQNTRTYMFQQEK